MSQPDIVRGTRFVLALGDGATPTETFDPLCGLIARQFQYQANTSDQFIRDCTDPDDIPLRRVIVTGEQWNLSGNGNLNRSDVEKINAAKGVTRNYRFYWTEPADDIVFAGYYEGPAILNDVTIDGNDDNYAQISLSLVSDGEWTFTATQGS